MLRTVLCSLGCLLVCAGVMFADEIKAKFVKFDADKKVLTISADGKDKEYKVSDEVKFGKASGEKAIGRLGKMKADQDVTLTVEKDLVTEVKAPKPKADK
jgi:hypothetical protein